MARQDEILADIVKQATGAPTPSPGAPGNQSQDDILKDIVATAKAPSRQNLKLTPMSDSDRARRDAVTPYPGIDDAIQAIGDVSGKIDRFFRHAAGAPETGQAFAKKMGVSDAPVVDPKMAPSANPRFKAYWDQNPIAAASAEVFSHVPKSAVASTAYELAASPTAIAGALLPRGLGLMGRLADKRAGTLAKAADMMSKKPVDLELADAFTSAIPGLAVSLSDGHFSPEKLAAGAAAGIGTALARRYAFPPAAKAAASVLRGVSEVLGPEYLPALQRATDAGVAATQFSKLVQTPEGVNTLKVMLGDFAQRPQESMMDRLKRRSQSK